MVRALGQPTQHPVSQVLSDEAQVVHERIAPVHFVVEGADLVVDLHQPYLQVLGVLREHLFPLGDRDEVRHEIVPQDVKHFQLLQRATAGAVPRRRHRKDVGDDLGQNGCVQLLGINRNKHLPVPSQPDFVLP
eukprot:3940557-Rhodomonas_salina.1